MAGPPIILGKYELLDVIGDGAEGRVYRAACTYDDVPGVSRGEIVALKRLKSTGNDKESQQFRRQIDILRKLNHPNIVQYRDSFVWREKDLGEDIYCLVMELLDGDSLKSLLANNRNGLPWMDASAIVTPILGALRYAAKQGVIHRDLKPSNIHLTSKGIPKLIDFGIARQDDGEATATSSAAGAKGTFDYMAPDFALIQGGFRGDEQSDIFSFGVLFFNVLSGRLPLPPLGDNAIGQYYVRWLGQSPPTAEYRNPAFRVLSHARSCISKCIEPNRKLRFSSFDELITDFAKVGYRQLKHGAETYEFVEWLGKGGFGEVFRARRARDKRELAIKRLFSSGQSARFVREAKILRGASHPNLTEYIDFVEVRLREDEREYYLVLEYLEGMPGACLRDRIKASVSGLDASESLRLFVSYLSCLEHLHRNGIIHRDIKPGNLYAPEHDPQKAKIFDLGIAHDEEGTKTHGQVPGTLDFMPPEFAAQSSGRGSAQTDIYSIAVTLYLTLTKKLPFPRLPEKEADAWVAFIMRASAPVECTFDHPVFTAHPNLIPLLRQGLANDPKRRQESAKAMGDQILSILDDWDKRKAYDEAMVAAREALERRDYGEVEFQAGKAAALLPRDQPAKQMLLRAQDGRRTAYDAAVAAAQAALERKNYGEAKREATRAIELSPQGKEARQVLTQVEEAMVPKKAPMEDSFPEEPPTEIGERPVSKGDSDYIGSESVTISPFEIPDVFRKGPDTDGRETERPQDSPGQLQPVVDGKEKERPQDSPEQLQPVVPSGRQSDPPAKPREEPFRQRKVPVRKIMLAVAAIALVVGSYFGWIAVASWIDERAQAALAERETKYKDAMAAGLAAFAQKDFSTANARAVAALESMPRDPQALKLQADAQVGLTEAERAEREAKYKDAMAAGLAALERRDFSTANDSAREALGVMPDDAPALKLQADAQAGLKDAAAQADREAKYRDAMAAGLTAFAQKDFSTANARAVAALASMPDDAPALKLQADAQAGLKDAAAQAERDAKYNKAMEDGRAALERRDFSAANDSAGEALGVRLGDTPALKLQADAQAGLREVAAQAERDAKYNKAMKEGRAALERRDFSAANDSAGEALGVMPSDPQALKLKADAQVGLTEAAAQAEREAKYNKAMEEGRAAFDRKDVSTAISRAKSALENKPGDEAATQLLDKANGQDRDYRAAIKQGRDALIAGHLYNARKQAVLALGIEPDGREAKKLNDDAQQRLGQLPSRDPLKNVFGVPNFDFVWVPDLQEGEGAYVEVTELSQAQYHSFIEKLGLTSSKMQISGTNADDPENLDYVDAAKLGKALNAATDISHPKGQFQLPGRKDFLIFSEVKGLTKDDNPPLSALPGFMEQSGANASGAHPRSVEDGNANKFGLYNVLGNAWEWCDDQSGAGFEYDSPTFETLFRLHRDVKGQYTGVRLLFVPVVPGE